MKLKNQVVGLELAKRLKEAGYSQEGLWYWNFNDAVPEQGWYLDNENLAYPKEHTIVAPTVAELGEMLPYTYHSWKGNTENDKNGDWLCVSFSEPEFECDDHWEQADTEADARASMWLYLKKEKLI